MTKIRCLFLASLMFSLIGCGANTGTTKIDGAVDQAAQDAAEAEDAAREGTAPQGEEEGAGETGGNV